MGLWGEVNEFGEKEFSLHPGQEDILLSKARFKAAIAGTGGGKTAMGPVWCLMRIQEKIADPSFNPEKDEVLGLVVAPTYQIMARATAPTFVKALSGTDLEGRYVESRNRYYLPQDLGVIWFLSADNPHGLEAGQFDWAWIDEGGQIKYDAWIAVQGRVGQKQGPVLITTTPYGQNWLYHRFFKMFLDGDEDYYVRQWPSLDNPSYSRAEYERAKKTMSPNRAAMRYDGEFMKLAGLVYPDLDSCQVSPLKPPSGTFYGGIDFGWNDPFCALGACHFIADESNARDFRVSPGDDILYIFYERFMRHTSIQEHAEALVRIPGCLWFGDPSRPDSINDLRRYGVRMRGARNSILTGIDRVNARIYTKRIRVSSSCKALFSESQHYAYPEEDDEAVGEKPIDDYNHTMDALRYLVSGVDRKITSQGKDTAA